MYFPERHGHRCRILPGQQQPLSALLLAGHISGSIADGIPPGYQSGRRTGSDSGRTVSGSHRKKRFPGCETHCGEWNGNPGIIPASVPFAPRSGQPAMQRPPPGRQEKTPYPYPAAGYRRKGFPNGETETIAAARNRKPIQSAPLRKTPHRFPRIRPGYPPWRRR